MASEMYDSGLGSGAGPGMGMADEHDGNQVVRGIFPCQSSSVSGLLRDGAHPHGSDTVRIEEMGLLDCMAFREHRQSDTLPEGRAGLHADCQLPVSGERHLVPVYLVQIIQKQWLIDMQLCNVLVRKCNSCSRTVEKTMK